MKNLALYSAMTLAAVASPIQAETLRLVVSYDQTVNQQALNKNMNYAKRHGKACINTLDNSAEICVPMPTEHSAVPQSKVNIKVSPFKAFDVDKGNASDEQVIETLKATGWYKTVERDVVISTGTPTPNVYPGDASTGKTTPETPNDPDYQFQKYLQAYDATTNVIGSGFTNALANESNGNETMTIAVLDSSFWETSDIKYIGGASFTTVWDNVRGTDNYLFADEDVEQRQICGGHGTGVAGTINATINNNLTGAGAIDNANVYAMRVMQCGYGVLSDVSDALRYIAGTSMEGLPDFEGKIDVANLSLGGALPECPSYLQTAIDDANAAGITVVVAAGNYTIDVADFAPANCDGVIVVGATDKQGNQTDFSNYGDNVDIMMQGVDIVSGGWNDETTYWWEGTSFAAPLVASAAAILKREASGLNTTAIKMFMERNVTPVISCPQGGCGEGYLNIENTLADVQAVAVDGNINSLIHALDNKTACEQQWYVDHFGATAKLCSLYKATFLGDIQAENTHYRVTRRPNDDVLGGENDEVLLTTTEGSVFLSEVDVHTYDYTYQICENGQCGEYFILDTSRATNTYKPRACQ